MGRAYREYYKDLWFEGSSSNREVWSKRGMGKRAFERCGFWMKEKGLCRKMKKGEFIKENEIISRIVQENETLQKNQIIQENNNFQEKMQFVRENQIIEESKIIEENEIFKEKNGIVKKINSWEKMKILKIF